jgi:hypothetical protein
VQAMKSCVLFQAARGGVAGQATNNGPKHAAGRSVKSIYPSGGWGSGPIGKVWIQEAMVNGMVCTCLPPLD